MDQTIICTVLLCGGADVLYVLSDRPQGPDSHKFTYAGQPIEAAESDLPGVPQIPAHWLERLRTQALSQDRRLTLQLVDEFSGGDPQPKERPYFPWDLEPQPERAQSEAAAWSRAGRQLPR